MLGRGIFKEKGQSESSGHRIGVSTSLASDMFLWRRSRMYRIWERRIPAGGSDCFHAKEEVERPKVLDGEVST